MSGATLDLKDALQMLVDAAFGMAEAYSFEPRPVEPDSPYDRLLLACEELNAWDKVDPSTPGAFFIRVPASSAIRRRPA